jgi:hypothetical protein
MAATRSPSLSLLGANPSEVAGTVGGVGGVVVWREVACPARVGLAEQSPCCCCCAGG